MKSRRKKRLLAMVLCVVMILSLSISVMAEGSATASDGTESEAMLLSDGAESSETTTEPTPEPTAEPTPEVTQTPEATPEVTPEPVTTTPTPIPETVQEDGETVQTDVTTDESQTSDAQNMETEDTTPDSEQVQTVQPYESSYEDNDVVIRVSAEAGIVPDGAVLSVTPIVKRDVTDDMSEEEKAQVEAVNAQYDLTEKKLIEDSEANEETMEGFLAYDISFLVDGVEVEPSGDVNVTMEFKQAALPEGVSEDASISVKHLKEEAAAVDGVVVEDMAEKASVQTTNAAAVEKVELTAESFSTFTIIWGDRWEERNATVHYVDENGKEILGTRSQTVNLDNGDSAVLRSYAEEIEGYNYKGAHLNSYNGTEVYSVKYSSKSDWTYKTEHGGKDYEWKTYYGRNVYLVYEKIEELTTVPTVDNVTGGITMRMIDYGSAANDVKIGGPYSYNDYSGYVKQGLLDNKLQSGYPVTTGAYGGDKGLSLTSLFSGGKEVNHLFLRSTYDETGYYEYSSFDNYAYLGNGTDFTVYEQLGTPSDHKNDNQYFFNRGNFLPYNQLDTSIESGNRNLYNEEGDALSRNEPRYGEELYTSKEKTNYFFGMFMDVNFSQPEDGTAVHNGLSEPMIYEFNGDDDLWVYIDDVLVLDIGGIHDAHSGYINFATGKVHVECVDSSGRNQNTTIKDMFKKAGVFPDGSRWDDERVDIYFWGDTFRNYTTHNMKMFYMERGAGASNLHMRFNLQTVPEGTIEVTKELSNTDQEKYANIEFAFQVYAQKITGIDAQGNETYSDDEYVLLTSAMKDGEAVQFHNNVQIGTDAYNGVFYLKPGETASFSSLQKDRKYYVKEIGVKSGEYDRVIINGTEIISTSEEGEISKITDITSSEDAVGSRPHITFENNCSVANRRELRIRKQMSEGQTSTDTFTFRVQLEGTDGRLTDYSGPYYLTDSQGNYWYYNEGGELVLNGKTSRVCGMVTDGQITDVQAGYTVAITTILSGTDFKVWEVDPNITGTEGEYNPPEYEVEHVETSELSDPNSTEFACGEIKLGEDALVTVTNSLAAAEDQTMIRVQKTFQGLTQEQIDKLSEFKIDVSKENDQVAELTLSGGTPQKDGVTISGPAQSVDEVGNIVYIWEVYNVGTGSYSVSESGTEVPGYILKEATVNGNPDFVSEGVETAEPKYEFKPRDVITPQGETEFQFDTINAIIISFTSGDNPQYLVWTVDRLSAGEREGFKQAVADADLKGQFGQSWANASNTENGIIFYSTRELISKGFYFRGQISISENGNLVFEGGKQQWNMICVGNYVKTDSIDADLNVQNIYKPQTVNVDLQKYGSSYTAGNLRDGAVFEVYRGVKAEGAANITWESEPYKTEIAVKNDLAEIELTGLESGYYKLKEVTAPIGFQLLEEDICFKVDATTNAVTLVNNITGDTVAGQPEMWRIPETNKTQIQILNEVLYDLPSAGGPGIYMYMVGGVLLMSAGVLMIYRNKRREVLRRK